MRDFRTVFAYELRTQLKKKTAIITTVVLMVIMLAATFLPQIISLFQPAVPDNATEMGIANANVNADTGYVIPDESLKGTLRPVLHAGEERMYKDREALVQALRDKTIEVGFVIASDLSYEAVYLDRPIGDTRDAAFGDLLSGVKKTRLIGEMGLTQEGFAAIEASRAEGFTTVLGRNSTNNYALSFAMMFAVYMGVLLYGNGVSSVIAREKDSRTMEILITSTRPSSLILGKVAATGLAALIQFGMVILVTVIGYQINKGSYPEFIRLMLSGSLSQGYVLSFAFFSFFGFILYLFLFAALGSTVSKMEDLASATALVQFLFIFAYLLATFAAQMPSSAIAVIGSVIPFTSIMVMPLRAGMMTVPWGELLLAGGLMLLFVAFFAFLSIKIYRWGTLNYGNKTRLSRIVREALRHE
jgi:ABC-2 type transport system permease protein